MYICAIHIYKCCQTTINIWRWCDGARYWEHWISISHLLTRTKKFFFSFSGEREKAKTSVNSKRKPLQIFVLFFSSFWRLECVRFVFFLFCCLFLVRFAIGARVHLYGWCISLCRLVVQFFSLLIFPHIRSFFFHYYTQVFFSFVLSVVRCCLLFSVHSFQYFCSWFDCIHMNVAVVVVAVDVDIVVNE